MSETFGGKQGPVEYEVNGTKRVFTVHRDKHETSRISMDPFNPEHQVEQKEARDEVDNIFELSSDITQMRAAMEHGNNPPDEERQEAYLRAMEHPQQERDLAA